MSSLFAWVGRGDRESLENLQSEVRHRYTDAEQAWTDSSAEVVLWRDDLASDDQLRRELLQRRDQFEQALGTASSALAQAERETDLTDLDNRKEVKQALSRWQSVQELVGRVAHCADRLSQTVASIHTQSGEAHRLAADVPPLAVAARQAVEWAQGHGFRTDELLMTCDRAERDLRAGGEALEARRLADAHQLLTGARDAVVGVQDTAHGLPGRHSDLLARLADLQTQLADAELAMRQVARTVERLRSQYVSSVWQRLDGMPERIQEALGTGHASLDRAEGELSMDQQRLDDASTHLERAEGMVAELRHLQEQYRQFDHTLTNAISQYPNAHASTKASLRAAESFVRQYTVDVSPALQDGVAQASRVFAEAEQQAQTGTADPHHVLQRLREVYDYAGSALQSARADVIRRDQHRSHAQALLKRAESNMALAHRHCGLGLMPGSRRSHAMLQQAAVAVQEGYQWLATDPGRAERLADDAIQMALSLIPRQ